DGIFKPLLELFSLEKEEVALLPGGLFIFGLIKFRKIFFRNAEGRGLTSGFLHKRAENENSGGGFHC
ncbi:MAG TPA: hypothetical protein VFF50_08990, partial [Candidatus Deferrimicrobiaceae bacterium]|nr:hypothetical protein [Candidatus Deferrimicrobiaceae bacterium]